jgi:hypothetical protein
MITYSNKKVGEVFVEIMNLYEANKQAEFFTITKIPDILLLKNLGIRPGIQIHIKTRYAFGGPLLLQVEGMYSVAVGKDIAKQIMVTAPVRETA